MTVIQVAYEVTDEALARVRRLLDVVADRDVDFNGARFQIERADFTCIPERDDDDALRLLGQVQAAIDTPSRKDRPETPKEKAPVWCIEITFSDEENNGFVTLGGAGWESKSEWESRWAQVPVSPLGDQDPANLIADKLDQCGDQVDEKFITAETAEFLLGRPLAELIEEGRANTAFTLSQVLERDPELAAEFPRLVATVKV